MKKKILLQKLYIATVVTLSLISVFLGLVYLTLVVIGPAPSMSYLISHSEFDSIFVVFVFSMLSIALLIARGNKKQAHFLLPTWMKEPINQYYAETPKSRTECRKDYLYITTGIAIALLISLLAVAFTLTDEAGELIF